MVKQLTSRLKGVRKKAVPKPTKQSERTLHFLCQQWVVKSGYWNKLLIFHVPNERRGSAGTGMHFKRMGVRPGVADYLVFNGVRDVAIELKDEDGKQSDTQKEFQRHWEKIGKTYFIVRTLQEFQAIVHAAAMFG
jgi:hypothetical protein